MGKEIKNTNVVKMCTIHKIVYDSALEMGKEAAVAEGLNSFRKCPNLYTKGLLLLKLLEREAVDVTDKAIIQEYILAFEQRLHEVEEKLGN